MLLVMVAHLFVLEVRHEFEKNENGDRMIILTMPQACLLIIAALAENPRAIQRAVRNVAYYQKSNAKDFW